MIAFRLLAIATLPSILACGQAAKPAAKAATGSFYISPTLGIGPSKTIDAALKQPFPDSYTVTLGKPPNTTKNTVNSCADLQPLAGKPYTTGSALDDTTLRALATHCEALNWIRAAKPAAHPAFRNFSFQQITARQLPPELAMSISDEETANVKTVSQQGGTLLTLIPDARLRVKSANKADLIAPEDWTATLTVYAHGDLLGDGNEQLLILREAKATGGTYTSTTLFLLARQNNRLVVVRQYP